MSSGGFAAAAQLKNIVCKSVNSPPKVLLPTGPPAAAKRRRAALGGEKKYNKKYSEANTVDGRVAVFFSPETVFPIWRGYAVMRRIYAIPYSFAKRRLLLSRQTAAVSPLSVWKRYLE